MLYKKSAKVLDVECSRETKCTQTRRPALVLADEDCVV